MYMRREVRLRTSNKATSPIRWFLHTQIDYVHVSLKHIPSPRHFDLNLPDIVGSDLTRPCIKRSNTLSVSSLRYMLIHPISCAHPIEAWIHPSSLHLVCHHHHHYLKEESWVKKILTVGGKSKTQSVLHYVMEGGTQYMLSPFSTYCTRSYERYVLLLHLSQVNTTAVRWTTTASTIVASFYLVVDTYSTNYW